MDSRRYLGFALLIHESLVGCAKHQIALLFYYRYRLRILSNHRAYHVLEKGYRENMQANRNIHGVRVKNLKLHISNWSAIFSAPDRSFRVYPQLNTSKEQADIPTIALIVYAAPFLSCVFSLLRVSVLPAEGNWP